MRATMRGARGLEREGWSARVGARGLEREGWSARVGARGLERGSWSAGVGPRDWRRWRLGWVKRAEDALRTRGRRFEGALRAGGGNAPSLCELAWLRAAAGGGTGQSPPARNDGGLWLLRGGVVARRIGSKALVRGLGADGEEDGVERGLRLEFRHGDIEGTAGGEL
jgi:hypothetical protein